MTDPAPAVTLVRQWLRRDGTPMALLYDPATDHVWLYLGLMGVPADPVLADLDGFIATIDPTDD